MQGPANEYPNICFHGGTYLYDFDPLKPHFYIVKLGFTGVYIIFLIPMGTNCALLLADLFLYLYEPEFVQSLLQAGKKHLAQQLSFTYRYIDDVLSLKNTKFAEYLEFIYPCELEIKETTETAASSSYLDCYLYIDSGKLTIRLYDKRDDFNFPIVNFPSLSSNITSAPAYGVYVSVNPLCQSLFKLSGLRGAWESAHYKVVEPGVSKTQTGSNT